jgi:DNA topoisomerase VI subunit B
MHEPEFWESKVADFWEAKKRRFKTLRRERKKRLYNTAVSYSIDICNDDGILPDVVIQEMIRTNKNIF